MAAKTEAAPPPAAAPAPEEAAAPAEGKKGSSALLAWLPLALTLVLAPALSWAVAQFFLLPRFARQLNAPPAATAAAPETATAAEGEGHAAGEKGAASGKKGEVGTSYEFSNVVVNLAGTMGTRYLKTTFLITSTDTGLRAAFESNKAKLVDVTLNVLSSLTLSDLEEAGAKNLIREKLVTSYNQALGRKIAEQVYFSDFVVQ